MAARKVVRVSMNGWTADGVVMTATQADVLIRYMHKTKGLRTSWFHRETGRANDTAEGIHAITVGIEFITLESIPPDPTTPAEGRMT